MLSPKKSLNILRKTNALLEGHFVLSSGLHSSKYIQCAKLLSFPDKAELQNILRNGDTVKIITSKNNSPSLHWIPITKTGKARSAIRRYWHDRGEKKEERIKKYNTTLWISLPDKPGQLGNVSSLIGQHKLNISNLEMAGKNPNYINFKFQLIIKDLKNFTNFIAELKQKGIKFKIIRHEDKRNAFTQKILRYFKKN